MTPDPSETRVTDPVTGGAKGQKLARFDLIPPDVLWALAEHYGKGEAKYPTGEDGIPNWQKGYAWRLSVAALERHFNQWKRGEDIDPETGSHHLIPVIWHAIALWWFAQHGKGQDFRGAAISLRFAPKLCGSLYQGANRLYACAWPAGHEDRHESDGVMWTTKESFLK